MKITSFIGLMLLLVITFSLVSIAKNTEHKPAISQHQYMITESAILLDKYRRFVRHNEPRMALHALDAYSVADPSLKLLGGETVWHKDIGATTKMIAANENVMNTVKAQYVRKYGSYLGSSLYGWHIFGQMKASALF